MLNYQLYGRDIKKLGEKAKEFILQAKSPFPMHSVFANAINLLYENDYLITIQPDGFTCGSQSIILTDSIYIQLKQLEPDGEGYFPISFAADVSDVSTVELCIPYNIEGISQEDIRNNIDSCWDELKKSCRASIMVSYLMEINTEYTTLLTKKLDGLAGKIASRGKESIIHELSQIIGLGPGLTPSGDDFIYGLLAALYYGCTYLGVDKLWIDEIVDALASKACKATTIISYNMLRSSKYGVFNEAVRNLTIGLLCDTDVLKYLPPVLDIGSTSGSDIAAGILYGFKIIF